MIDDHEKTGRLIRNLKNALMESLTYDSGGDMDDILRRQAGALDAVFRKLLADGGKRLDDVPHYQTALKAQNQFRQTAMALKSLKDKSRSADGQ